MRTYWLKERSVEAEPFDYSQEAMDKYNVYYIDNFDSRTQKTSNIRSGSEQIILISHDTNKPKRWIVKHQNGNIELLNDDAFRDKYQRRSISLEEENTKLKKDDFTDKLLSESFSERCASVALLLMFAAGAVVAVLAAWKCVFN